SKSNKKLPFFCLDHAYISKNVSFSVPSKNVRGFLLKLMMAMRNEQKRSLIRVMRARNLIKRAEAVTHKGDE
ncbi:hypothetical protein, partial [Neobacillus niacini]|uniref:hypothetical protein n=1 Tax=Neobacillus niacini TaxID=86668 RepID=UPI0005F07B47